MSSTPPGLTHRDERGQPCAHHPDAPPEALLALATIGSRGPGFNHDIASKLQGLMMALDEIGEVAEVLDGVHREQLARAAEAAQASLKDVLVVLNVNRAMTKTPMRSPIALPELAARAGERVYVVLRGALPEVDVSVSAPTMIHALSLVLDVAGGPGRGRTLAVEATRTATHVAVSLPLVGSLPANAPECIAIATYVLARDGGSLHCANDGATFVIQLPLA